MSEAVERLRPGTCSICGASLDGRRRDATYCSATCRREAARRRLAASEADRKGQVPNPGAAPQRRAEPGCRLATGAQSATPKFTRPNLALTERIAAVLANAGNHPKSGYPESFTYRALARIAYALGERQPTKAQLSAVRRSVALLVRDGRAERDDAGREHYNWERTHYRTSRRGYRYLAPNPGGVRVRRALTAADHETRAETMRPLRERIEARRQAIAYPVDTGGGIEKVMVEPVFKITANGVELRQPHELNGGVRDREHGPLALLERISRRR